MSKDEIKDIPLRELVRQSMAMTEQLMASIAKIEVHNLYTKEKVGEHDTDIDSLKNSRSHQRGSFAIMGAIGLAFIIDFFKRIWH